MSPSEFEIECNRLTNVIALKRSFLTLLKKHSVDNSRVETVEQDLKTREYELTLLFLKKPI